MKILCISDTVMPQLESAANLRRRYSDIDLILSSGDLPLSYLDFITTMLGVPLYYVRGNHDERYIKEPPGGVDLHQRFVKYKGVTFFGLEGSINYNNGKIQYTQAEMNWMVLSAAPHLRYRRWRYGYSVDVFVTHSPAWGIHDAEDLPHRGFKGFLNFLKWYRPRYMVHGHVHTWDRRTTVSTKHLDTHILNINPYTVIEVEPLAK